MEELKEIEQLVREMYTLDPPSLSTKLTGMNNEDCKSNFTKYSEYKSIIIEDFLNFCLRNRQICKKPEFVVLKLRIHEYLWDYLNKWGGLCACAVCRAGAGATAAGYKEFFKLWMNSEYCIVNSFKLQKLLVSIKDPAGFANIGIDNRLTLVNCQQGKIEYSFQSRQQFGKQLEFRVFIKKGSEESQVKIEDVTVNDTCREVVSIICAKLGITESQDLFLVYSVGKQELYLDNDECIYTVVKHLKESYRREEQGRLSSASTRSSIFSRSFDSLGEFSDPTEKEEPKLYIRKAIIFPK
jgi:hypothetical protein